MARHVFKLPDVGEGTAEAEITAWHVALGDEVAEDAPLVDVMTDKATVEMTAPVSGKVVALHGAPGEMAKVGAPLVEFEIAGEDAPQAPVTVPEPVPKKVEPEPKPAPVVQGGKVLAAPALRQRARELGVDLSLVEGSGPEGRVTHGDLDAFLTAGRETRAPLPMKDSVPVVGGEEIRLIGLRRKIAEKMQEAKLVIPHFAYVEEIDMSALEDLRDELNAGRQEGQVKLTLLPFLIRALVQALPDFPQVNARFDDGAGIVHRFAALHVGIATQTEGGLVVPVLRDAQELDLWHLAARIAELAGRVREGKASREELSGSTITITSLGKLGGVATTPIINHPEVAILGPNAIVERVVVRDGQMVVRKMMNLSSSFDHRVVDGYDAARFVQRLKQLLEQPALLFVE